MGYTPAHLNVRKVAGGVELDPGGVTTDDFKIMPNSTDPFAFLTLYGNGNAFLSGLSACILSIGGSDNLIVSYVSPDTILESGLNNKNLFLKTNGTGKIKVVGTATGTGDVAVNGHYDILDESGATIKLATVA